MAALSELTRAQLLPYVIVAFTLVAAFLLYRMMQRGLRTLTSGGHLTAGMSDRLQFFLRALFMMVVGLALTHELGIVKDAWAVISALLATVAIGFFALWSVLVNVVCALMIVMLRPFRPGDELVLLEGGVNPPPTGRVVDVNFMYTTLEGTDENGDEYSVNVPNSWFFQKIVRKKKRPETRESQHEPFFRA